MAWIRSNWTIPSISFFSFFLYHWLLFFRSSVRTYVLHNILYNDRNRIATSFTVRCAIVHLKELNRLSSFASISKLLSHNRDHIIDGEPVTRDGRLSDPWTFKKKKKKSLKFCRSLGSGEEKKEKDKKFKSF